jgi:hypothetical protein
MGTRYLITRGWKSKIYPRCEFIFSFQEKHNIEVTREGVKPEIDQFNDEPIKPVAELVDLIKFRPRLSQRTENISQLASFYQ